MRRPSPQTLVRLAEVAAWAAFLVCLRQVFAVFEVGRLSPTLLFNGDTLFAADLCLDLASGGTLADWSFPHTLPLFPDGLLWLVTWGAAPTTQGAVVAFGAAQVLLVAGVTRWLLVRELGPAAAPAAPAAFAVVFVFFSRAELLNGLDVLRPLHHFGVVLTALLAFALLAAWLEHPGRRPLAALGALLFVGCLSDPFTVTCVAAPCVAVLALVALRDRSRLRAVSLAAIALTLAAALGTGLARSFTSVEQDLGGVKSWLLADQLRALGTALGSLGVSAADALGVLALLLAPVFFVRGVRALRQPTLGAVLDVTPLLALVANQAALLLTGNVVAELLNRYQVVVFGLLVVLLARAAAWLLKVPLLRSTVPLVAIVACAVFLTSMVQDRPRTPLARWQPTGMACVVAETTKRGAVRGLADVPTARPYSLLNGAGLRLDQLEQGKPRWWLSTRRHFATAEPPWSFALLSGPNAAETARALLTPHSELVSCPGVKLIFWDAAAQEDIARQLTSAFPRR